MTYEMEQIVNRMERIANKLTNNYRPGHVDYIRKHDAGYALQQNIHELIRLSRKEQGLLPDTIPGLKSTAEY